MRVLIIDDHSAARAAMRQQIMAEWPEAEVQEAPTLRRGLMLIEARRPDAAVLDLALPDAFGEAAVERVFKAAPGVRLLALCREPDLALAARVLALGGACVSRASWSIELVPALRRLQGGGRFVTAALARRFLAAPDPSRSFDS